MLTATDINSDSGKLATVPTNFSVPTKSTTTSAAFIALDSGNCYYAVSAVAALAIATIVAGTLDGAVSPGLRSAVVLLLLFLPTVLVLPCHCYFKIWKLCGTGNFEEDAFQL